MRGKPVAATGSPLGRPRWIQAKTQYLVIIKRIWGVIGAMMVICLAMAATFGILSLYPDQSAALNFVDAKLLLFASSVIAASGYEPGLLVLVALGVLTIHGFRMLFRAVTPDEADLSSDELALMRTAGRKGWVVDCRGEGEYTCYGPAGEQERFGDLADLEHFVQHELEDAHGSSMV
jgi:hypothetical protein